MRYQDVGHALDQFQVAFGRPCQCIDPRQQGHPAALQFAHAFQLPLPLHAQPLQQDRQRAVVGLADAGQRGRQKVAQLLDRLQQPDFLESAGRMEQAGPGRPGVVGGHVEVRPQQGLQMLQLMLLEHLRIRGRKQVQQPGNAVMRTQPGMKAFHDAGQPRLPRLAARTQQHGGLFTIRRGSGVRLAGLVRHATGRNQRPPVRAVPLARFHLVHRLVRATQQLFAAGLDLAGIHRDAQAGTYGHGQSVDHHRELQDLTDALQQPVDVRR